MEFQDWEKRLLRVLSEPLPLVAQPYAEVAARAGVDEARALERIRAWVADGTIRRLGARVAHREVGFPANGMSVWNVPEARIVEVGNYMAAQPEVSHCYQRDFQPGWEYNLFGMIHGGSEAAVLAVAARIADHTGLQDYTVLFSTHELKKTAPRYFVEKEDV
jgi:DNA-binding Lrp family transcriptional regulator